MDVQMRKPVRSIMLSFPENVDDLRLLTQRPLRERVVNTDRQVDWRYFQLLEEIDGDRVRFLNQSMGTNYRPTTEIIVHEGLISDIEYHPMGIDFMRRYNWEISSVYPDDNKIFVSSQNKLEEVGLWRPPK